MTNEAATRGTQLSSTSGQTPVDPWRQIADAIAPKMSRDVFGRLLGGLFGAKGLQLTTDQMSAWYVALADMDQADFARAITIYLRQHSSQRIEIQLIRELAGHRVRTEDRAIVAFNAAKKAVRVHGAYRSVSFDDVLINAVIRETFGGWAKFCDAPLDEWAEKRFAKHYSALLSTGPTTNATRPLIGICAASNAANGFTSTSEITHVMTGLPVAETARRMESRNGDRPSIGMSPVSHLAASFAVPALKD